MPVLEIWILVICLGFVYVGYLIKVKKKIGLISGIENPKNYDQPTRDKIAHRFGGGFMVLALVIALITVLNYFFGMLTPFYLIFLIAILFFVFMVIASTSFKK